MKKNKLFIGILTILVLFLLGTISYGACSVPAQKTVDSGKEFTLSISSSVGLEDYGISLSTHTGIDYVSCSGGSYANNGKISYASVGNPITSLGTYTFKAPEVTEDKTYSIKFNVEADMDETLTSTITVKAQEKKEDPKPTEEKPTEEKPAPSTTTEKPAENKPVTNKEKEEPKLSSNNKLENLGIEPLDYDFHNFDKSYPGPYYATVPYEVSKVKVYAKKKESSQKVTGTGDISLKVGDNPVNVVCEAENGTTKTYKIIVKRLEEDKKEQPVEETPVEEVPVEEPAKEEEPTEQKVLGITGLNVIAKVEDGKTFEPELMPVFNENEYEYQVTVPLTATEIEVNVEAEDQANIEVMGNKDLKDGINNVTVMVKIGEDTKIYQIVVNKVEMKPTSALSDTLITQLAIIAAIATAIIVAIIVLIIAIVRSKRKNNVEIEEEISETEENNESETENKEE